jgi:hypothetical protein
MKQHLKYVLFTLVVLTGCFGAHADAQTAEGGSIKGKVKEARGKSLEGVTVRCMHAARKELNKEVKTDGKGDFELSGLEPGQYSLSFEKQGYKTFTTRKLEVVSGETVRLRQAVELPTEGEPYSVIRGAVLYGVGYSLPNASVSIERIDGVKKFKQETISREAGEFAFRLKADKAKYRVTAVAKGFEPATTEIEIVSDEVRNVSLTLQPIK